MKKLTLLLVFALLFTSVLASCSGNYDEGQPNLNAKEEDEGGEKNNVDVKYNLKYKGYTYNIYDGKEIEITSYDFGYVEEATPAAEDDEDEIETVSLEVPAKINDVTVTKIGEKAFEKNSTLEAITLPEGIKEIAAEAFWYNSALESIVLPESLEKIGERAFSYCKALKSLEIPAAVTEIPADLCNECTSLESVDFKGDIKTIGSKAFAFCISLSEIDFGNNLVSIGNRAFTFCTKLADVTLPDSVETVGVYAFDDCTSLVNISFGQVKEIGESAFENCANNAVALFRGDDATKITLGKFNAVIEAALGITVE